MDDDRFGAHPIGSDDHDLGQIWPNTLESVELAGGATRGSSWPGPEKGGSERLLARPRNCSHSVDVRQQAVDNSRSLEQCNLPPGDPERDGVATAKNTERPRAQTRNGAEGGFIDHSMTPGGIHGTMNARARQGEGKPTLAAVDRDFAGHLLEAGGHVVGAAEVRTRCDTEAPRCTCTSCHYPSRDGRRSDRAKRQSWWTGHQ